MERAKEPGHPYCSVDLAKLDAALPSLLAYAAKPGLTITEQLAGCEGLSRREKWLFRLGLLIGHEDWSLAREVVDAMLQGRLLTGSEVERVAAEVVLVEGWLACYHLLPLLRARGLSSPASVAEAAERTRAAPAITLADRAAGVQGLSERELFALGLGLTWGAKCWDT